MAGKKLRIGLIGYGFMGRAHSNAFRQANVFFNLGYEPELTAVCGRDAGNAQAHADQWGYASVETDWQKLIARDDIDLIDIAAPNDMHKDIAIAAAKAGKMATIARKNEPGKVILVVTVSIKSAVNTGFKKS